MAEYEPLDLQKEMDRMKTSMALMATHFEELMRRYQRLEEILVSKGLIKEEP
jgi:hypothetical protein